MAAPRLTSLLLSSRRLVLLPRPALAAPRHLATSPVMAEYFFTKKHEWVNVEGNKGEVNIVLCRLIQRSQLCFLLFLSTIRYLI